MTVWTHSTKIKFVEKVFGRSYLTANQKNMEVHCPVCDHKDKAKKKLSIRVSDDFYNCWICGARGRSLLFLLKKYSTAENVNEYLDVFMPTLKNKQKNIVLDTDEAEEKFSLPNDFKLLALESDSKDPDVQSTIKYLYERGITERDLWYYKFGCSNQQKWFRRALMPSFDAEGTANFIVGRSIDSKRMPKYQTPQTCRKSLVFNELNINWQKQLVLCEGVFDLIKCGENAVPLLGSSLNEQSLLFERIVMNLTPIILALDSDMADSATPRIAKKLAEYQIEVKVIDMSKSRYKDPGDMTRDEFQELISGARSLDWFNFMQSKLNRMTNVSLSR